MSILTFPDSVGAKQAAENMVNALRRSAAFAPDGFMHDREPPAEWEPQLREVSPLSDELGWLAHVWEAGDPWGPGQRWGLYEMVHLKHILSDLDDDEQDPRIQELRGPHPRSEGHMCSDKVPHQFQCLCRRKMNAWRGGPCNLITLTQWKLFHRYGGQYLPVPFWVIQGDRGGHKWEFNEQERQLLRMSDLPDEPPRIGQLPYADFDQRVLRQIVRYNKLMAMDASIAEYKRTMGDGYAQYKTEVARKMRADYLGYLAEQTREEADMFIVAARKGAMDNQEKTDIDYVRLGEHADQHFVETGEVLDPSQLS